MKEVFRKRRSLFLGQCLKYLRYVLNDHFVLVLLFLYGKMDDTTIIHSFLILFQKYLKEQ